MNVSREPIENQMGNDLFFAIIMMYLFSVLLMALSSLTIIVTRHLHRQWQKWKMPPIIEPIV